MENLPRNPNLNNGGTKKILIADDDISSCVLLSEILMSDSINIVCTSDGIDAVALCQDNVFDLIIMDIQMPIMNGIVASEKIHQLHPTVPIIIVSASVIESSHPIYSIEGICTVITKPYEIQTIRNIIDIYMQNNTFNNLSPSK